MKCDQCELEATVHELRVVSGKKVEKHLCERCARKQGIAVQPSSLSVPELIEKYIQQAAEANKPGKGGAPGQSPPKPAACPKCGTEYLEFRKTGLLGCSECYATFEAQLGPLLERAHEGGTHHIGKLPQRRLSTPANRIAEGAPESGSGADTVLGGPSQRADRVAALRKQLDEAIRTEQYEHAASIRDELNRLAELEARLGAGGPRPRTE